MRTELPTGSWLKVEVREDNKPWKEVRKVAGQARSLSRIVIPVGRCDKFELRLSGTGQFTLLNMLKEFDGLIVCGSLYLAADVRTHLIEIISQKFQ